MIRVEFTRWEVEQVTPGTVGYPPRPWVAVCDRCGMHRRYRTIGLACRMGVWHSRGRCAES